MKRLLQFLPVIVGATLLTGCFEIKQTVDLKKNGSGVYTMTLDLSTIAQMGAQREVSAEELYQADKLGMQEKIDELNSISGVSGAKTWADQEAYTLNLSFNFEDIDALNKGAQTMFSDSGKVVSQDIFSFDRKGFHFHGYGFMDEQIREQVGERTDSVQQMMFAMLSDVNFATEVNFGETVDRVDNNKVLLTGDRHGVVLNYHPFRKSEWEHTTDFSVVFE